MNAEEMSNGESKAKAICDLNDRFRKGLPSIADVPGQVMLTLGIQALTGTDAEPAKHLPRLFEAIRTFDDFTDINDPYGEHDFGVLDFEGARVFWKIDNYAPDLKHGSEDPADATKTVRVLTIMLAEEY